MPEPSPTSQRPRALGESPGLAVLVPVVLLLLLQACGAGAAASSRPTVPVEPPDTVEARREIIDELGHRAWAAMAAGDPDRLLIDDVDLRVLLDSTGATRLSARRPSMGQRIGDTRDFVGLLGEASYAGVCLQGAREEAAGGVTGLRSAGWLFDRVLVIGRRPTGRRIAAWIEGLFVHTDAGVVALDLERVERPRWEHSDLEIAPCDLSIRDDLPRQAR